MPIIEFIKYLNLDIDSVPHIKNSTLHIDDGEAKIVIEYLKRLEDDKKIDTLKNILEKNKLNNGAFYEVLVYSLLWKYRILFEPQVSIGKEDCLKINDFIVDGIIGKSVYFDIKQFGITFPLLEKLLDDLNSIIKSDTKRKSLSNIEDIRNFEIKIVFNHSISTRIIQKELLEKKYEIINNLFDSENKVDENVYRLDSYKDTCGISIVAYNSSKGNDIFYGNFFNIDYAEWAENNSCYFFYHASQFCTKKPFIIICPYREQHNFFIDKAVSYNNFYAFRLLARRVFISFLNDTRKLNEDNFDGKAKHKVSLGEASKYLSGILFLNVDKSITEEELSAFMYINPNANKKVPKHILGIFRSKGVVIDDFEHDNY